MKLQAWALLALGMLVCLPHSAMADDPGSVADVPVVGGAVQWPGVDWFPGGRVVAAKDARFKNAVAVAPLTDDGHFILPLPPGKYYLMVSVDLNADGKPDAPDGLGFYGVEKESDRPKALSLTKDAEGAIITIRITMQFAKGGRLREATVGEQVGTTSLSGTISRGAHTSKSFVVAWPEGDGAFGAAAPLAADGSFSMTLPAGRYVIFAVSDDNASGDIDSGDAACVAMDKSKPAVFQLLPGEKTTLPRLALDGKWQGQTAILQGGAAVNLPVSSRPAIVQISPAKADAGDGSTWCRLLFFADPKFRSLAASTWVHPGAWLAIRPATYFALLGFDLNGDGVLRPGDKLAMHADAKGAHPPVSFSYGQITDITFAPATALTADFFKPRRQEPQQ